MTRTFKGSASNKYNRVTNVVVVEYISFVWHFSHNVRHKYVVVCTHKHIKSSCQTDI